MRDNALSCAAEDDQKPMMHLTDTTIYLAGAAPAATDSLGQSLDARFEPDHFRALTGRRAR
jgi:hypothetical protein